MGSTQRCCAASHRNQRAVGTSIGQQRYRSVARALEHQRRGFLYNHTRTLCNLNHCASIDSYGASASDDLLSKGA